MRDFLYPILVGLSFTLFATDLKPCVGENGLVGFCNEDGELIIPHIYSNAFEFISGHAPVQYGSKWGIIDEKGNWMVKPTYDEVMNCDKIPDLILVRNGKKWSFINAYGIQMSHEYEVEIPWNEFEITNSTAHFNKDSWFAVIKNGKWGVIDVNDSVRISFKYDWARVLRSSGKNQALVLKKEEKYGWFDLSGKKSSGFIYDEYLGSNESLVFFLKENGIEIINAENGVKEEQSPDERYTLVSANDKMGMIGGSGQVLIPFEYEIVNPFSVPGLVLIESKEKVGLMDLNGQLLLDAKFKEIKYLDLLPGLITIKNSSGRVALAKIDGSNIQMLSDYTYNFVVQDEDRVLAGLNTKIGEVTADGEVIWPN